MTVGQYLRRCREAAGVAREGVAARFATEPRWAEHVRAEWLEQVEADVEDVTFATVVAISRVYPVDYDELVRLVGMDRAA